MEGENCCRPLRFPCSCCWRSDRVDRKQVSLTPCTYTLSPQIPQNRKVIGGWHSIGQLQKEKQRQEVSEQKWKEDKNPHPETLQIQKIWLTTNDINLIADTIHIIASVMEHASIMGAPFAWLENHQTLQHYYDVCVSWERGTESNSTKVISNGGLRCLAAYTLSVTKSHEP